MKLKAWQKKFFEMDIEELGYQINLMLNLDSDIKREFELRKIQIIMEVVYESRIRNL